MASKGTSKFKFTCKNCNTILVVDRSIFTFGCTKCHKVYQRPNAKKKAEAMSASSERQEIDFKDAATWTPFKKIFRSYFREEKQLSDQEKKRIHFDSLTEIQKEKALKPRVAMDCGKRICCKKNDPAPCAFLCFTCELLFCKEDFEVIHLHPEKRDHIWVSIATFSKVLKWMQTLPRNVGDPHDEAAVFTLKTQLLPTKANLEQKDDDDADNEDSPYETVFGQVTREYIRANKKLEKEYLYFNKMDLIFFGQALKLAGEQGEKTITFENLVKSIGNFQRNAAHSIDADDEEIDIDSLFQLQVEEWNNHNALQYFLKSITNTWAKIKIQLQAIHFFDEIIDQIHNTFGASMEQYFLFLRWSFYMNMVLAIISFMIVILPTTGLSFSDVEGYADDLADVAGDLLGEVATNITNTTEGNNTALSVTLSTAELTGLLVGIGMENTTLFYGGYEKEYGAEGNYNMLLSYTINVAMGLMVGLMFALTSIGGKDNLGKEDKSFQLCSLVFSGQQMSISNEKLYTQNLIQAKTSLLESLKEKEQALLREKVKRTTEIIKKNASFFKRYCGQTTFFRFVSLMLLLVSSLVVFGMVDQEGQLDTYASDFGPAQYMIVPVCISLVRIVVGKALSVIVFELEGNPNQSSNFRHYFARVLFGRILCMYVMVGATYNLYTQDQDQDDYSDGDQSLCLETRLGVLFYRVLLYDILVELLFTLIYPFLKVCILNRVYASCVKCCSSKPQRRYKLAKEEEQESIELTAIVESRSNQFNKEEVSRASENLIKLNDRIKHRESELYEESLREEFDVLDNIADILYRQMLIFSGLSVSPYMPILGFVLGFPLVYLKFAQVKYCSSKKHTIIPVTKQHRFFRFSLVLVVMLSVAPFTMFLSTESTCGPYGGYDCDVARADADYTSDLVSLSNLTCEISDIVVIELNNDFGFLSYVLEYASSAMVLWFVLIICGIALIADLRISASMSDDIKKYTAKLKSEIESHNHDYIRLDTFLEALHPAVKGKYGQALKTLNPSLSALCKLDDKEIEAAIETVNKATGTSKEDYVLEQDEILYQLSHYRHILAVNETEEQIEDEDDIKTN